MTAIVFSTNPIDFREPPDTGDTFASAQPLLPGEEAIGRVTQGFDPLDFYSFTATTDGLMRIQLRNLTGALDLGIYAADGSRLATTTGTADDPAEIGLQVLAGATYYIRISILTDIRSNYRLTVEPSPWSGTSGDDRIDGNGQDNTLAGFDGNDTLFAYAGDDVVYGGRGNDSIRGGMGDDEVSGGGGMDTINGGEGNDTLYSGDAGAATIAGAGGNDLITGSAGSDLLHGNDGNDTVRGGDGDNKIFGGAGDDHIVSGLGQDRLWGGTGNDIIVCGSGTNQAWGEAGADRIFGGSDVDVLYGGDSDDRLEGKEGMDLLFGDAGNDTIMGGEGGDVIDGGIGGDLLFGDDPGDGESSASDTIYGGDGSDTLYGSGGDILYLGRSNWNIPDFVLGLAAGESSPSRPIMVVDFVSGIDFFDFRRIDADTTTPGDQAFVWSLNRVAHGVWTERGPYGVTVVFDVDGDSLPDSGWVVTSGWAPSDGDFLL